MEVAVGHAEGQFQVAERNFVGVEETKLTHVGRSLFEHLPVHDFPLRHARVAFGIDFLLDDFQRGVHGSRHRQRQPHLSEDRQPPLQIFLDQAVGLDLRQGDGGLHGQVAGRRPGIHLDLTLQVTSVEPRAEVVHVQDAVLDAQVRAEVAVGHTLAFEFARLQRALSVCNARQQQGGGGLVRRACGCGPVSRGCQPPRRAALGQQRLCRRRDHRHHFV